MDKNDKTLAEDLTLALLYLSSWEVHGSKGTVLRTRKDFDPEILKTLQADGDITIGRKTKAIEITQSGQRAADGLLRVFASREGEAFSAMTEVLMDALPKGGFRFRVTLDLWGELTCWREIVVPKWFTFLDFHEAIQASFLWWNYHLFNFELHSQGKDLLITTDDASIDSMFAAPSDNREKVSANSIALDSVFPRTRKAMYCYDYGDDWQHSIEYLGADDDFDQRIPLCVDGDGDAPPEDVGSVPGFKHFLAAIGDPSHEDHESMTNWGYGQFYEPFSLDAVNARIEKWFSGELLDEWDERNPTM